VFDLLVSFDFDKNIKSVARYNIEQACMYTTHKRKIYTRETERERERERDLYIIVFTRLSMG